MTATAHFDLKMDADEKAIVAKAAALLGTTMAGFVRLAAKEKAQVLLDREARLTQAIPVNVHCAKRLDPRRFHTAGLRRRSRRITRRSASTGPSLKSALA